MFSFRRITFVIAVYLTSQTVANSKETSTISERVQIYDETDVQAPCVLEECADSISNSNSRENQRDWSVSWESIEDWKFGDSGKCPTGRLFDSRWKKLREDILFRPYVEQGIPDPGIRVFSIRVKENITISLVGWSKLVQIYVGTTRIEFLTIYYNSLFKTNTWKNNLYYPPKFVDQDGWRTFTLEWKKSSTEIKLTTSSLNNFYINETLDHSPYLFYNLSIESSSPTRIRFHNYTYLHTTNPGAELITSDSFEENEDFCIETLTRLCNGCKLNFYIIDYHNSINELGNINYDGEYAKDDKWITLRIDQSKIKSRSWPKKLIYPVKIKLSTDMVTTPRSGRWAIANYRKCSSEETSNTMELKASSIGIGIVEIRWKNPWISRSTNPCTLVPSYCYTEIEVRRVGSKISNYPPEETRFNCVCAGNESFKLQSATEYRFDVKMTNSNNDILRHNVTFWIPASVGFANGTKELEVKETDTSINITIPEILNIMSDSIVKIIVVGEPTCSSQSVPPNLRSLLSKGKDSKKTWISKSFEDPKAVPRSYSIPKKMPNDKTSSNCHLLPAETYYVIVAVVDSADQVLANISSKPITLTMQPSGNPTTKSNTLKITKGHESKENWTWLYILLILLTSFLLLYIWRRKLLKTLRQIHQEDIIYYWHRVIDYVKPATICPFQVGPSSLHLSTVTDLFLVGSRPELDAENSYSNPISVQNFENYVQESIVSGQLKSQFTMFPRGLNDKRRHKYGSLIENKIKNRYANIVPYDDTRVILKKIPDVPYSDYINASYVEGFDKEKSYIAAQGPKPETIEDFWRMVWQEESLTICMLANVVESEKIKCSQYWPEFGSRETYGDITVFIESQKVFADYTFRTFCISYKGERRKIEHLHYTGWPDHKVPLYVHSVISYLKKLLKTAVGRGPTIVHCSAGVGRTGTLILCDICLRQAAQTGTVDVVAQLKKLRDCRLNMVDTELQYVFAHIVMAECLAAQPTDIPCNNDLPLAIESIKEKLPQHIQRLNNTAWQDEALCPWMRSLPPLPEHLELNRYPELAPDCSNLVYLTRNRAHDYNDYISAVTVDGFKFKKQFLASQLPMPSTIRNLWRLIAEQKVELIIILQHPDPEDPTCCDVIMDNDSFSPVPSLTVEVKTRSDPMKFFQISELLLTNNSGVSSESRQVTVLTCTEWGLGRDGKPPPPEDLVSFWIISEEIHREQVPTLVLCHDGVTGCGLYLALSFVLERMAVERECDIILAVRAVRRARPRFVQSQEQFEYLYNAAAEYIKSFETYANFD